MSLKCPQPAEESSVLRSMARKNSGVKALSLAAMLGSAITATAINGCSEQPREGNAKPAAVTDAGQPDVSETGSAADAGIAVDSADGATICSSNPDNDEFCNDEGKDPCPFQFDIKDSEGKPMDTDSDGITDACEIPGCATIPNTVITPNEDKDGDRVCDPVDNASGAFNPGQEDVDGDNVGDVRDNCDGFNPADPFTKQQIDADGDGYGVCGAKGDCDDQNPNVNPGAADPRCDGLNTNCSNAEDAGCACVNGETRPTGVQAGICLQGQETCADGAWETTRNASGPLPEICDGLDNDCNGVVDPGCECLPGAAPRACGGDIGECKQGIQSCGADGQLSEVCVGEVGPSPELCNGKDDDCNDQADDGFGIGTPCDGNGACRGGVRECAGPQTTRCSVSPGGSADGSSEEICNGIDDNCDGRIDEGEWSSSDGARHQVGSACSLPGVCGNGTWQCSGGAAIRAVSCSSEIGRGQLNAGALESATPGFCNGADDDCDGRVDDGCACQDNVDTRPCGSNIGACQQGTEGCANGGWNGRCNGNLVGPSPEVCGDDVDNDCDDTTDEGCACNPGATQPCGTIAGECTPGTQTCGPNGQWNAACAGATGPQNEAFNGLDDDCDGGTDEGFACQVGETRACGNDVGTCNPGIETCTNGQWNGVCGGPNFRGPVQETCDGRDNDCDGVTDNLAAGTVGQACRGVGACNVPGTLECDGANVLRCSVNPGGTNSQDSQERCDGIDNDCDREVDEGLWPGAGAVGVECNPGGVCGIGVTVCTGQNATRCSSLDRATMAAGQENPNFCDGQDNDCDGSTDEGCACAANIERACGNDVGECQPGVQTCSADGRWGTCEGEIKPLAQELCNGKDDDCDNATDEGFNVGGQCRAPGACGGPDPNPIQGTEECLPDGSGVRCSTGPGGSSDRSSRELCDRVDNDCDRETDEGIGVLGAVGSACNLPGVCGDGAVECNGVLNTRCSSEQRRQPGDPCDGADNNCDGQTDEGFGLGNACSTACGNGVMVCTQDGNTAECSARRPTPEVPGNGVDEDCDGQVDEQL